jgi:hypothetical protein
LLKGGGSANCSYDDARPERREAAPCPAAVVWLHTVDSIAQGVRVPSSTLEIRWFFSGSLEQSGSGMEVWFRTRPRYGGSGQATPIAWDPTPPAWRQDRYLLVPGSDDMGIKWREGRLEIKGLTCTLGPQVFAPGIAGECQHWLKWSYAGDAIDRRFHDLFENGTARGVVAVEKRRLQRRLNLGPAGIVDEVRPDDGRERGINIELAEIRVPGPPAHLHWSLAFEAFPSDQVSESFAQIVAGFLAGCPALPLSADESMSYPRWLLGFDRPSAP